MPENKGLNRGGSLGQEDDLPPEGGSLEAAIDRDMDAERGNQQQGQGRPDQRNQQGQQQKPDERNQQRQPGRIEQEPNRDDQQKNRPDDKQKIQPNRPVD